MNEDHSTFTEGNDNHDIRKSLAKNSFIRKNTSMKQPLIHYSKNISRNRDKSKHISSSY